MNNILLRLVLVAVIPVAGLVPSIAHADCAMGKGFGIGAAIGTVGGAILGAVVFSKASDEAGIEDEGVNTIGKGAAAALFGVLGLVTGGVLGLGTGAVMCFVEDQSQLPVYAQDSTPLLQADASQVQAVKSTTLIHRIEGLLQHEPSIRLSSASLLDRESPLAN